MSDGAGPAERAPERARRTPGTTQRAQVAAETRARILETARELFAAQGYAGTSIAHITTRLGMSKAALYYHFRSKEEIVDALLAEPLAAYARLAEAAANGRYTPEELLGALIDTTASAHRWAETIGSDPSVRALLAARADQRRIDEINNAFRVALAGPGADREATVRAHAAYTVAKHATLTVVTAGDGRLEPAERAELLAAAMRALGARTA